MGKLGGKRIKLGCEEQQRIATLYGHMPLKELSKLTGRAIHTLSTWGHRWGLSKEDTRKYTFDEGYFESIDTAEKAYWLGFVFADGGLQSRTHLGKTIYYGLSVEVIKSDEEHIKLLQKAVGHTGPLRYRRNTVCLSLHSKRLAQSILNLRPKETAQPWKKLDQALWYHFARGVFDGDGTISKPGAKAKIEIYGSRVLCEFLRDLFGFGTVASLKRPGGWLHAVGCYGKVKLNNIAINFYGEGGSWLERKFDRFLRSGAVPLIAGGALPNQISNSVPTGADAPSTIDNRIRSLALAVEDILGIPDATNISAAGFGWDSSGLSSIRFQNAAVTPSASGHLQRVADNLMYHDGTSSYGLVLDTKTGTIANKTFNNPSITGTVSGGATYTSPVLSNPTVTGEVSGVLDFSSTHTLALNPSWRISATVGSNNLTVAIKNIDGNDPTATSTIPLAFISPTLTDARTVIGTMSTATSVVVPATGTLGFTGSQTSRVWVGAYYDAGAAKPFVWHTYDSSASNYSILLPGPNTISTTAVSSGSDSAGVAYATAAISNAPWQWLGYIEIQSGATAGNWSNSPSVQRSVPAWGPKPGMVIQDIFKDDGLFASGTGTIADTAATPSQTDGNQFMKQSVTYTSAINLAEVSVIALLGWSTNVGVIMALFQGSGTNAIAVLGSSEGSGSPGGDVLPGMFRHVPGTAGSSFEYKLRAGLTSAGTTYFNSSTGGSLYGGLSRSSIRIREIMV